MRVFISVAVTSTALLLRGSYLLLLNNFDAEKYLIIDSVNNDDWIFPIFIAWYFGFEDLVPITSQVISAWISIENNKATIPKQNFQPMLSNWDDISNNITEYENGSSIQSHDISLNDLATTAMNSYNKTC